jgi:ribosome assembly protein YihI (activator of Der GTPase)
MESTAKFTGMVDRDLLRRAKLIAAKTDTSIDALFNAELRYLVETFEAGETSENQNFKILLDFALGRINDETVMDRLGIDSDEDLFLLMTQARLPMPHLPEDITKSMQDGLHALVR